MKKILIFSIFLLLILTTGCIKLTPYYTQLTKPRVGLHLDQQPQAQKNSHYVGSQKCKECHNEKHHDWMSSLHSKMIQDIKENPDAVIADFTGYMSKGKRVEPTISCESCHGPASKHIEDPESPIFNASHSDPIRSNEVCFQCHMSGRDKRPETQNLQSKDLWMDAKDYPSGYEPGKPLINYKLPAPFSLGKETKEFWANGAAKKNRTQGNEYIHDRMYAHGITCINCHDPHKLTNTAQKPQGNDACMKCHSFGSIIGPHQDTLEAHTNHKADSIGSSCIECHMPKTAKHTDKSPLTVRSHLFTFTYPAQTKAYGMPAKTNACFACHQDKTLDSLQSTLKDWGKLDWGKLKLPQNGFK